MEEDALAMLWDFVLQPVLFTSIGFELNITKVSYFIVYAVEKKDGNVG